jgi:transcriptional regulator with XRE-family HTH domain
MSVGSRIKVFRRARKLTQQALADQTCTSRDHIQAIEGGRKTPSLGLLLELARTLGVPCGALLDNTPGHVPNHFQLDEFFEGTENFEVRYREYSLSSDEVAFIRQIVESAVDYWAKKRVISKLARVKQ